MNQLARTTPTSTLPVLIAAAVDRAVRRFLEFFAVNDGITAYLKNSATLELLRRLRTTPARARRSFTIVAEKSSASMKWKGSEYEIDTNCL